MQELQEAHDYFSPADKPVGGLTVLRAHSGQGSKAHVVAGAHEYFWPKFASGSLTPPGVTVYPMDAINDVHRLVEAGEGPAGKIVFEVSTT